MNRDRWARIEALFQELIALPPEERESVLLRGVPDDPELRAEVEALLRAESRGGEFLEGAVGAAAAEVGRNGEGEEEEGSPVPGERIGPYRVLEELGRGGMGSVHLAERADDEYRARVAIKVIRGGAGGAETVRRFRSERQILAGLNHPNVARLLDGGTTSEGGPWLALEYVDGQPIDRYCDERRLGVDARIDLFLRVCDAVQYAHGKLVVHRDLKPGNVLVTDDGTPKLLDFGIAKLLERGDDSPDQTGTHLRLMTPAYASPEQVRGEAVTTATDVYALGLLLYELLAGRPAQNVTGSSPVEVEREVCVRQPRRPGSVVDAEVAAARNVPVARLARTLAGDLDNIVLTALRKEPDRRYASVSALADDLRRYREGRPVVARGTPWGYRAGKFVRRNLPGVTATALVALLFLGTVAFYTIRLAGERDRAQLEAERATAVADFLGDLFRQANPDLAPGAPATARDLLDRGAEQVRTELQADPGVRAQMLQVIGVAYQALGQPMPSVSLLEEAAALRRDAGEPESLWSALDALGVTYWHVGRQGDSEATHREALDLARSTTLPGSFAVGTSLNNLGKIVQEQGRFEEAGALFDSALVVFREVHGPIHPSVATALANRAQVLGVLEGAGAAETLLREALQVTRELPEGERLNEDIFLANLASNLVNQGRLDEAEPLLEESVVLARDRFGQGTPRLADKLAELAFLAARRGDQAAAEAHLREALPVIAASRGERHPDVAYELSNLAAMVDRLGRGAEADSLHREAVAISREALSPEDPFLARALNEYGTFLFRAGRHTEAVAALREAYEVASATLPPGQRFPAQVQGLLGRSLVSLGRREEGVQALLAALPVLREAYGPADPRVTGVEEALAGEGVSIPPLDPPGS